MIPSTRKKKYTDEQIIEMYKKLCEKLGKTAGSRDITKAYKLGEICGYNTINTRFNSLTNLQVKLGYKTNPQRKKTIYTKENLMK